MSEANEVMIVIKGWVKKAENDLKNASYTLGKEKGKEKGTG